MKIYLAGPDVFRPDAESWFDNARTLCARFGFEALTPLDHAETYPERIFEANLVLIRRAQILAANLNPFRGCEPDSGTCFEMGYALALGKKICAYVEKKESLLERVCRIEHVEASKPVDSQGMSIENFGLPLNLMLAVPAQIIEGGLEDCLKALRGGQGGGGLSFSITGEKPPIDPRVQSLIEDALRYLRWAAEGRIVDDRAIATVAEHYKVSEEKVRDWVGGSLPSGNAQVDYLPEDVIRRMKIAGRQYRSLK